MASAAHLSSGRFEVFQADHAMTSSRSSAHTSLDSFGSPRRRAPQRGTLNVRTSHRRPLHYGSVRLYVTQAPGPAARSRFLRARGLHLAGHHASIPWRCVPALYRSRRLDERHHLEHGGAAVVLADRDWRSSTAQARKPGFRIDTTKSTSLSRATIWRGVGSFLDGYRR